MTKKEISKQIVGLLATVEDDDNIEEMAVKIKDIADSILPGIIMEESRSAEDGR